jgi:hypothetical protein
MKSYNINKQYPHLLTNILIFTVSSTCVTVRFNIKKTVVSRPLWNVMAHAQKPDFVSRRNGRVHLNRRGLQFSRLLTADVCASAVAILVYTMFPGSVKSTDYPLHSPDSPSLPLPCVTVCHHVSTGLYRYGIIYLHANGISVFRKMNPRVRNTLKTP